MKARLNKFFRWLPNWVVYLLAFLWAAWLFYQAATGAMGVEPINALERAYGELALQFIVFGLAITPLRTYAGLNLIKLRRALGVTAFFFVLAHLLVFVILDLQSLSRTWTEIVKRPYITIGMLSFLALLPLAVTSNNRSVKRLGAASWRKLHKLTYIAALLGAIHYVWLAKGFQLEPIIYTVVIVLLLLLRVDFKSRFSRPI